MPKAKSVVLLVLVLVVVFLHHTFLRTLSQLLQIRATIVNFSPLTAEICGQVWECPSALVYRQHRRQRT